MKKLFNTALILIFLISCTTQPSELRTFTLQDILNEFSELDAQHNTSWRAEIIPQQMIDPRKLPQMKQQLDTLRANVRATSNDSIPLELVEARIEMINTQAAYYLGSTVPLKLDFAINGLNVTLNQTIPCTSAVDVVRSARLYEETLKHYFSFMHKLDNVLQSSAEAKQKIGVDKTRPAFYNSGFSGGREKLNAIKTALEEQCGITFELSSETKQALRYAEQVS